VCKEAEGASAVWPVVAHLGPEVCGVHVVLKQVVAVLAGITLCTRALQDSSSHHAVCAPGDEAVS
jgi:hypothetical protein